MSQWWSSWSSSSSHQTIRLFIKSKVVLLQSRDTYRPASTLSLTSQVSLDQTTVYDSGRDSHGLPLESKLPVVALVSARLEGHRLGEGLEWEGLLSRLARERVLRRGCRVVALADSEPLLGLLGHDDVLRGRSPSSHNGDTIVGHTGGVGLRVVSRINRRGDGRGRAGSRVPRVGRAGVLG
jgi:hypothetical protein